MKYRLDGKAWAKASLALHVALLAMAAASYFMALELDLLTRSVLFTLACWLCYLLFTKGPEVGEGEFPALLRYYYWTVTLLMFLVANILFVREHPFPAVPIRLVFLGVLIPFAIMLRMRVRTGAG